METTHHPQFIAQVDHLYEQLRVALVNALFVTVVATVLFYRQTGEPFFLLWFGAALAVVLARDLLYRRYRAAPEGNRDARWLTRYRALATLHGLLWAVLALAALAYGGTPTLSLALIMLAGITAGAVATNAADLTVFLGFSVATLLPVSAYLLFETEATRVWLGVLGAGFLLGMVQLARNHHRTFCEALSMRFENQALLRTLSAEKQELANAKEKAESLAERLFELSSRDGLTGLSNRRAFDEALTSSLTARDRPLSLILCDLDAFKAYNDRYGHVRGDLCLKRVATALREVATRPGDLVARYGGEEFGVVLPDTDERGATSVAWRLREAITRLALTHETSPVAEVMTASFGVACAEPGVKLSAEELIERADRALYLAKTAGRDRVVAACPSSATPPTT